jgi:hypothetical protein
VPCIPRFGGAAVTRGVDDGVTATILSLQPSKLFSSGKGPQKIANVTPKLKVPVSQKVGYRSVMRGFKPRFKPCYDSRQSLDLLFQRRADLLRLEAANACVSDPSARDKIGA